MKKLCRKGTVHPSPAPAIKTDDQFLSLLPVAILSLVAALSAEDREVLAYLISNSGDSNRFSHLKKNKTHKASKEDNQHSPLFVCDCFSCYTSYWVRWDSSPSRQLIHEIIDAFEDSLEMKKRKKDRRKRSGKASVRVDSVGPSRLSELGSSSAEFVGGDSGKDGNCGGEEAEKEKGSVGKVLSFIGQRFLGVWG
ncbi:unnamed protein product [Arabidopsis lyrata]|uniref:uncharacterized protein LOC9322537 n=1 Tax=Arabidopsis lyrata subsp. lyrata TaxID=81972 RepID=UPI000A29D2B8|nr:uncharacterized protein LOC9322537 [Arabidopsis lyrata subsp. lyrata]CAH8256121.1 unnamed protein product [Arabidopsis lyrata]|eukprot:XP_020865871.1 uncharacterized protein LOC9322537 [Arabidopsis lyrata subsp. lyrata]